MDKPTPKEREEHILDAIHLIRDFVIGIDETTFLTDIKIQSAVLPVFDYWGSYKIYRRCYFSQIQLPVAYTQVVQKFYYPCVPWGKNGKNLLCHTRSG